jgi:hypothetical protein
MVSEKAVKDVVEVSPKKVRFGWFDVFMMRVKTPDANSTGQAIPSDAIRSIPTA